MASVRARIRKARNLVDRDQGNAALEALIPRQEERFHPDLQLHRAVLLADLGRLREAVDLAEDALERGPRNPAHLLFTACLQWDAENASRSLQLLEEAKGQAPGNMVIRAHRSLVLLARGESQIAQEIQNTMKRVHHAGFESRLLLWCERQLGWPEEPERRLEECIPESALPSYLTEPLNLSTQWAIRAYHRWYARKLRHFQKLGVEAPAPLVAREAYWAGEAARAAEDNKAASESFRRAISLDPSLEGARLALFDLESRAGHFHAALLALQGMRPTGRVPIPAPNWAVVRLAYCFFRLRQWEAAEPIYRQAIQALGSDYLAPYHLALCLLATGNRHRARLCFERAVAQINPRIAELRLQEVLRVRAIR